jgi:uncharacterized protein YdhG (YjbR/CyaY superfamily)
MQKRSDPKTIDEYIEQFPIPVRKTLKKIKMTIKKAAPKAGETIKYRIPTFTLNGNLIFFAAFTNHIGLYPAPRGAEQFKKELSGYKGGKGTVQFPLDGPIPYGLITRIVKFRMRQNLNRSKGRKK